MPVMPDINKAPTPLQEGDAAVVIRDEAPENVVLGTAATKAVGNAADQVSPGNLGASNTGNAGDVLTRGATPEQRLWAPPSGGGGGGGGGGTITSVNGQIGPVVILDADDVGASPVGHTHADATGAAAGFMPAASVTKLAGIAAGADVTSATTVGAAVLAAATKATPIDADAVAILDSAASNALKRATLDSIKTAVIASLTAGAPALLDTLDELAAALGDDPNFATTMATSLAGKQPLAAVLTATTASFTTTLLGKLNAIEAGATADLTGAEIATLIAALPSADKLDLFEAMLADVASTDGALLLTGGQISTEPVAPVSGATFRVWIQNATGFLLATFAEFWTTLLGETWVADRTLGFGAGPALVQRTPAAQWDLCYGGIVSREAMQTAPFASDVITLDTSVNSRFAHATNLAADVSVNTSSWAGLADAGRTAELRVQCGATGYNLTVPAGTVFYNKPTGVLTPSRVHRFLLGKDGSTRTIFYVGAGETI